MTATPRHATARDPSRPTYGPAVAAYARALGTPLEPWQQDAADLFGELADPDNGRPAYPVCVAIVPRRAGKSALTLATMIHRAALGPRRLIRYTAQSGEAGASLWRLEWVPQLRASALAARLAYRESNGSQAITYTPTGSTIAQLPPTEKAGHGLSLDFAALDEAWAWGDIEGARVAASTQPAMRTNPHAQLMIVSAAGTASSSYLRRLVADGRAGAPGVALVEYGADPELDDPDDPDTLDRVHPGLAAGRVDRAGILADRATMPLAEWRRAYLGLWTVDAVEVALPLDKWRALTDPASSAAGDVVLGVAVAVDRATASIVAASTRPDGRTHVELVANRPGAAWLADELARLRRAHGARIVLDSGGPASPLVDTLARRRVPVDVVGLAGYANACQGFLDAVNAAGLAHLGQPALDDAVAASTRRKIGDRWAWGRRDPAADVTPLEAASLAAHAAATRPVRRPRVRSRSAA